MGRENWGEDSGARILRKMGRQMLDEKSGGEKSGARKVGRENWGEKSGAEESGTRKV